MKSSVAVVVPVVDKMSVVAFVPEHQAETRHTKEQPFAVGIHRILPTKVRRVFAQHHTRDTVQRRHHNDWRIQMQTLQLHTGWSQHCLQKEVQHCFPMTVEAGQLQLESHATNAHTFSEEKHPMTKNESHRDETWLWRV